MRTISKPRKVLRAGAVTAFAGALTLITPAAAFANTNGNYESSWWDRFSWSWSWRHHHNKNTCEKWQTKLNNQAEESKQEAQANLAEYNDLYTSAQTHVTTHNLTVENYEELNTNTTEAQTAATEATDAIEAPEIDCDQNNWKQQKADAREELNNKIKAADETLTSYDEALQPLIAAILAS